MKKKLFLFILLIMVLIPVYAKEENYKIVSGDIETLGSEICFDTECFYVIENDGNNVKMLAKYNLLVGNKIIPDYVYGVLHTYELDNVTGIQDPIALGENSDNTWYGTENFYEKTNSGSYWKNTVSEYPAYVYDKNSKIYSYLEQYESFIKNKGVNILFSRLISLDELENLGCSLKDLSCDSAPSWVYQTSYWTGNAYNDSAIYGVLFSKKLLYLNNNPCEFGVRPVIEIPVGYFNEEGTVYTGSVKNVKSSDNVISNDDNNVDLIFNDLGQQAKYEVIIHNTTDKVMYVNYLDVENLSEKFIDVELDKSSENMMIEPNGSSLVKFVVNTNFEEGAGRNLDDEVILKFRVSDKIYNPNTFSNLLEMIILVILLSGSIYFVRRNKSKKAKALVLIGIVSLFGISYVNAEDFINLEVKGKIKYESKNLIISTGTVLNGKQADYTNSKEVWAYYDKVKNVEVKSLINEPKDYFKKFDLTENKTGRVMAYLVENNDKDTPYDLVIMSNGVIVANQDSSFMFSFPKTEKVEGLSNIDFRETTTMQGMFIGNEKLDSVDAKSIEMDNTKDTSFMFYKCDKIEHDEDEFNLENVENKDYMIAQSLYNTVKKDAVTDKDEDFSNEVVNTGKYFMNDTKNDEFPIYYYRGDIKDNNVVFAGFCWKMVRTTDTGGTKLIYNGVVKEDGSCENTLFDNDIKSVVYNNTYNNIIGLGYMHSGNKYGSDVENFSESYSIVNNKWMSNYNYYYSDNIEYVDGNYNLVDAKIYSWKSNYENLIGKFTCMSSSKTSCSSVYYIIDSEVSYSYYFKLINSDVSVDKYLMLSKAYIKDGKNYVLENPKKIAYTDWLFHETDYVDYYICADFVSTKCNNLYKINSGHSSGYLTLNLVDIVYGNDVIYENGKYKLSDTFVSNNWSEDVEKIGKKYHYTCGDNSIECESVKYIIYVNNYNYDYYEFNNGVTLSSFIDEFHNNYSVDSVVKENVDSWYEKNMNDYSSYLEDTIWCNDRNIKSGALSGVNNFVNGHLLLINYRYDNNIVSVNCKSKSDSFTVSKDIGNGALTYPVGLLTVDELVMSGLDKEKSSNVNSYLNNSYMWWTMSPYYFSGMFLASNNSIYNEDVDGGYGYYSIYMRPSISLKNNIKYYNGDGSVTKPYVIE